MWLLLRRIHLKSSNVLRMLWKYSRFKWRLGFMFSSRGWKHITRRTQGFIHDWNEDAGDFFQAKEEVAVSVHWVPRQGFEGVFQVVHRWWILHWRRWKQMWRRIWRTNFGWCSWLCQSNHFISIHLSIHIQIYGLLPSKERTLFSTRLGLHSQEEVGGSPLTPSTLCIYTLVTTIPCWYGYGYVLI